MQALFILYVSDQTRARDFYRAMLQVDPTLDVPGMTEFPLGDSGKLGLMPSANIKRLLGDSLPDPQQADGIPRAELYLLVEQAQPYLDRAAKAGARLLSPLQDRNWGDCVGYCLDPDGHVVAIAEKPGGDLNA